ncbi:FimV/HubP family polar landmark protein [Burkholderia gladioli]|uniref:FimV/HubP family polar landmark protein n=1 Tax=Burkholderia gladioli TaxID=28095 RepID=UPI0038B33FD4
MFALMSASAVPLAQAAPSDAAASAPQSITVQPGQSLNDIAVAATQSRDPGVLARAGRALFAANPQAFMKHDPSRLKVGATLTVPSLDASGSAVASPVATSTVSGASAPAGAAPAHAGSAATAVAGAVAPYAGSSAAPGASSAGSVAGAHSNPAAAVPAAGGSMPHPATVATAATAAGASSASGASHVDASLPAHPAGVSSAAVTGVSAAAAVTPTSAALAQGGSAATAAPATQPGAAQHANGGNPGDPASAHSWSGSIQTAPPVGSSAAEAALLAPGSAVPATPRAASAPLANAPQARPSSLQQLLALKNRVLMELQLHGIGKPAPDSAAPTAKPAAAPSKAAPASVASAASGAEQASSASASSAPASAPPVAAAPAKPAAAQPSAPAAPFDRTAVIAVGVAAAALILGFAFRRRKRAEPDDEAVPAAAKSEPPAAKVADEAAVTPRPSARGADADPVAGAGVLAAEAAAQRTSAEPEAPAPLDHRDHEITPPTIPPKAVSNETPAAAIVPDETVTPAEPAAPAADLAAHTNTPDAAEPPPGESDHGNLPAPLEAAPPTVPAEPSSLTELNELTHPVSSGVPVHEFPADAVSALDSLDMPLPPRSGLPDAGLDFASHDATNGLPDPRLPAAGLEPSESTHPHETGEQKGDLHGSSAAHAGTDPAADELPLDDEPGPSIPESRPAPSFTPFGAAQFGALNLDFDLDLPAGPGATLPPPTEAALDQIARNKLELAGEYVELGDLHGARLLLGEVIDANRADTREAARAMLAKLADAS